MGNDYGLAAVGEPAPGTLLTPHGERLLLGEGLATYGMDAS